MHITEEIRYVGVNDHQVDLFEGQYVVPNGMSYHSYVILDEKTAVMDTVDAAFGAAWMNNISDALQGRQPDYLVVQHMEPDHSANIQRFMETYPQAVIVATQKAFAMIQQFFGTDYAQRRMVVGEGSVLSLGTHELTFVTAPMVHWPEVMVTYDAKDKVLFSADAFGKFGAMGTQEEWDAEARRYYFGIVGKFGVPVQTLLKKAAALDIRTICPLHGEILTENLSYYLAKYDVWSSYAAEAEGVTIACASVYGNTMKAAQLLADKLRANGCQQVRLLDLARCDMSEAVAEAFRCDRLVLASPTYNGDVFPCMKHFIQQLTERNYQNRKVAIMENGSWAPTAAKAMLKLLESAKGLCYAENTVTIRSALNAQSEAAVDALAKELC